MEILRIRFLLLIFFLLFNQGFAQTQVKQLKNQNVETFLRELVVEHNKNAEQGLGISVEFTGNIKEIPNKLEENLTVNFPKHKFTIANMNKFHMGTYPEYLLLVADHKSNAIISYAWNLPFDGVSDSFRNIFSVYQVKSKSDALSKVKALSDLLVFMGEGRVGAATIKKKPCFFCWREKETVVSELYYPYQPDGKPFRVLQVPLNSKLQFGKIKLINPFNGKEGSKASLSSFGKLTN